MPEATSIGTNALVQWLTGQAYILVTQVRTPKNSFMLNFKKGQSNQRKVMLK